jgi:hypothetical protein
MEVLFSVLFLVYKDELLDLITLINLIRAAELGIALYCHTVLVH